MRILSITIFLFTLMVCLANLVAARPLPQVQAGKGVIAGRVTVGETPVRDATVIATIEDSDTRRRTMTFFALANGLTFRAKTDYEGRFRLADLKSGTYQVQVFAPTMVNAEKSEDANQSVSGILGKLIALADDEVIENVNFSLVRGGVITGRATFADGRPVIAEIITLILETKKENGVVRFPNGEQQPAMTDDRGIYRIYGIPDGRYKVCLGFDGLGISTNKSKSEKHKKTFYPGVTDEAAAEWIEIKNGNEVRDIDIKLGAGEKAYSVAGRVVDADTGKALSDFAVSLAMILKKEDGSVSSNTINWSRTNSQGAFKLEGIVTGAYAAFAYEMGTPRQYYSDATRFEVNGADVSGIEVKVRRGLTVSGIAIIEDTTDPAIISELSQMYISASSRRLQQDHESDFEAVSSSVSWISRDGNFSLSGLRPGQLQIYVQNSSLPLHLTLIRVERDSLDMTQGFELKAGESITNLRVVLALANCQIRGQVKVEGGTFSKNRESGVSAVRIIGNKDTSSELKNYTARLDPNGRFLLDGLVAGEYELTVYASILPAEKNGNANGDQQPDGSVYRTAKQRVTVRSGQEADVTMVIKAREKSE